MDLNFQLRSRLEKDPLTEDFGYAKIANARLGRE